MSEKTDIVVPAQPVTPERLAYIKTIPKELMGAAVALVCSSEQYDLNRALNFAQLSAGQAIIDLVAEVEGLTASRNYGRDIINDMTLEADDFRLQVSEQLRGLLPPTQEQLAQYDAPNTKEFAAYCENAIRAAAKALGIEL